MQKIIKNIVLIFLLFILGCGQNLLPTANNDILLKLHNEQREQRGLQNFTLDNYLCEYAQKHAEWMAKKNNLKHSDINVLMGKYNTAGENIAWNQTDEAEATKDWMNSRGHRANILNKSFGKIGFGMARNSRGQPYWCTVFGN